MELSFLKKFEITIESTENKRKFNIVMDLYLCNLSNYDIYQEDTFSTLQDLYTELIIVIVS